MNVLAIGAHFDDVEIGCGGTIARHMANGDKVFVYVVTNSEYTNHEGKMVRDRETALREGQAAAAIMGYELICGDFDTWGISFNHELIEAINIVIDDYKIDQIYTHWDYDVHQDHQAIGKATLAAGRRINNLLMYRSNLYMHTNDFRANYFVDITHYLELKMKGICAHENEVTKFGRDWLDFWKNEARNNGQRVNVQYAEAFHLVKFVW